MLDSGRRVLFSLAFRCHGQLLAAERGKNDSKRRHTPSLQHIWGCIITCRHSVLKIWGSAKSDMTCTCRTDLFSSMIPVYELLLQSSLQMLVFSGDVDGIVPVIGTRRCSAASSSSHMPHSLRL